MQERDLRHAEDILSVPEERNNLLVLQNFAEIFAVPRLSLVFDDPHQPFPRKHQKDSNALHCFRFLSNFEVFEDVIVVECVLPLNVFNLPMELLKVPLLLSM